MTIMDDTSVTSKVAHVAKRAGGRDGRRALRSRSVPSLPALTRNIPIYEIVPEEAIEIIHDESLKILEEVGCEFRDEESAQLWKSAGADVRGFGCVSIGRFSWSS